MTEFEIRLGVPEIEELWNTLSEKIQNNTATKDEIKFYGKLLKAFRLLKANPRHNSLHTHEIEILSQRYGMKVWQSYLENKKPKAGRIYWIYFPEGSITIIGIEPHPDDNKHSYEKIVLSGTGK